MCVNSDQEKGLQKVKLHPIRVRVPTLTIFETSAIGVRKHRIISLRCY